MVTFNVISDADVMTDVPPPSDYVVAQKLARIREKWERYPGQTPEWRMDLASKDCAEYLAGIDEHSRRFYRWIDEGKPDL